MKEEDRRRIARMLEQDKEGLNRESRAQALRDFCRVAREYFDLDGEPVFTVEKERHGFSVALSFKASRVKNFTVVK